MVKTLRTQISYFALSGPLSVIWTEPRTPEGVDSYCLSLTNWATLRIFSVLLSRLERDIIASFLFGACTVQTDFSELQFLEDIFENS